jgi:tRNA-splicing ligase RtcB (3'-phosphate/5'-hydroxy nucleic acid ligase)
VRQAIAAGTTTARELGLGTIPVWSWLPAEEIEPGALEQITNLAKLPSAVHVAVMPDCHVGYGMPIGAALATKDTVVPYAVGVDIGCGMIAVQTDIPQDAATVDQVRATLMRIFELVPVGQPTKSNRGSGSFAERQNSQVMRRWNEDRSSRVPKGAEVSERGDRQVGTLGGGNHFIELQTDGKTLWLMLHTGSRAFGKFICDRYHETALRWCERYYAPLPHKELAFLSLDTDEGRDYLIDMGFAMRFAEESRKRIRDRALSAIEETFGAFTVGIDIETHHNFAAREKHMGKDVVVHRKGAVKTGEGLVTIPGSMQTGSYIAEGIANRLALDTCSHGAGRKLGRGAVRRANVGVDIRSEMEAEGVILVCPPESDTLDEAGRAYKDIEGVMAYQSDLARAVHALRPLGVVKG